MPADPTYTALVHRDQGGASMTVESGGIINVLTGGKLQTNGTDINLSALWSRVPVQDALVNGAITITPCVVTLSKAGIAAMTLADPAVGDEGTIITFIATTANAHTVSNVAGSGFNAGGTAKDIGTFGGAVGDNLRVIALGTKWLVLSSVNVTLA